MLLKLLVNWFKPLLNLFTRFLKERKKSYFPINFPFFFFFFLVCFYVHWKLLSPVNKNIYIYIMMWIDLLWILLSVRRKWQPTPVFLPGEFHGQRSLVGCNPWILFNFLWPHRLEFSRQEFSSELSLPFPGDLLNPDLLQCRQILYPLSHQEVLLCALDKTVKGVN